MRLSLSLLLALVLALPAMAQSLRQAPDVDRADAYVLLQFEDALPTAEALVAQGVRPVQYVDALTIVARVPAGMAKSAITGLQRMSTLDVADKLAAPLAEASLRGEARVPVIVEAYPQIGARELGAWVREAGGTLRSHPDLPAYTQYAEMPTRGLEALAARNGVAYVHRAPEHVVKGTKTVYCPGPITPYGPVANFETVGDGWDGPGLGSSDLTYYYVNGTPDLAGDLEQTIVEDAFAKWSFVVDVDFTESLVANQNDQIDILWGAGEHGDGFPFDGPSGVLAHAFFPSLPNPETIAGDMHFDEDETWTNNGANFDLRAVALHEIGHSIGLGHSNVFPAVMQPFYNASSTELFADDIAGARSLYATRTVTELPDMDLDILRLRPNNPDRGDNVRVVVEASNNESEDVPVRVYLDVTDPSENTTRTLEFSGDFPANTTLRSGNRISFMLHGAAEAGTWTVAVVMTEDADAGEVYASDVTTFELPEPPPSLTASADVPDASSLTLVPDELALLAPVPNPARGAVTLSYAVAEAGGVRVSVVDALGREVAVAAEGERQPGVYEAQVNLSHLAPGVYVARLASGEQTLVRRFTVVR